MEARARQGYTDLEARARARQGVPADRELEVLAPIIKADPKEPEREPTPQFLLR